MIEINKSALVPYGIADVFSVVNNVADYPDFLPGCIEAKVLEQSDDFMVATLCVSKAGIQQSFTTHNTLSSPSDIYMALAEGPFSEFEGHWQFVELADKATKINFKLHFVMERQLMAKAMESVIAEVASQMVDAVCKRLKAVYG